MKILHIIPSLDISSGGPVELVRQLCCELRNEGVDARIATTNSSNCEDLDINLKRPVRYGSVPTYYFSSQFYSFLPLRFCFSQSLGKWLDAHIKEFDLLHLHYLFSYPTTIAAYYANKYKVPYIIRPLGMLSNICLKKRSFRKKLYMLLFEKRNLKNAAAIHFNNEEELNAIGKFKLNNNKYMLVPGGLNLEEFKNLESFKGLFRIHYPQTKAKKIILFLSRIDSIKGLELLIPALKILSQKRNDFVFVLVGSGSRNDERWVRHALVDADLTALTILTGFYEGKMKMAALADSDIFILPSHYESFGMAVAEAMAAGLPVVISNRVNIHKLVEDYQAGIITELNSQDITVALDRLLSDEHLCIKMGAQGKKLVQEKFDVKNIAKQIIEIYSQLLRKAG